MLVDYHRRRKVRIDDLDVRFRIKVARRWLFGKRLSLHSVYFKPSLDSLSLTPTRESSLRNAFSDRLAEEGFNFYSTFVPDMLHEFELGVWEGTLMPLIRLLYAFRGNKVQVFNER
ncbi:hypothetical protein LXA43DRAFT_899769 [Ganoderma leucocontextum]|nr:hypothetical protein LXA43DRAFT_899769 [Ganoderma leucocontextum]